MRYRRSSMLSLAALLIGSMASTSWAGAIAYDGSLAARGGAAAGNLTSANGAFTIPQSSGVTAGQNLFHSFNNFSLTSGETALFTGANVNNVISRVTGGSPSSIDGTIRSAIPGANFYFLNPSGVMFGPNASLDISGSFHVSTADYLKLGDRDRFYVSTTPTSSFVSATPTAFGFLGNTPGWIRVEGSGSAAKEVEGIMGLKVLDGKTLSLIGGDITITSAQGANDIVFESRLQAPRGYINLASMGGAGEVILLDSTLESDMEQTGGVITANGSNYAGIISGKITVIGESINMENFYLKSDFDGSFNLVPSADGAGLILILSPKGIDIKINGDFYLKNSSIFGRLENSINNKKNIPADTQGGRISIAAKNWTEPTPNQEFF
ncbi:MAG: filamentous hemagglutinin N-terminal domain-containing protein [Magnetococcales bacterium]|nr:filamentous hemagglutinin N-terminal domain-containing protein [Magnetococcales bacterium]